jgi:sugar phosphate isomerase/epimerase
MKLGFWMLEVSGWTFEQVARQAVDLGYHGVDVRCRADSGSRQVAAIRRAFERAGVEISSLLCTNVSPVSGARRAWSEFRTDVARYCELAAGLGAARVRIVAERPDDGRWDDYLSRVWAAAGDVLDSYPGMGAVLQNHAGRATAARLFAAAEKAGDPRIGIELSPDHALVMQEDVLRLIERYTPYIHQVCWADRRLVTDDLARFDGRYYHVRYESCRLGQGSVATGEILPRLAARGFAGYCSLKWEKSTEAGADVAAAQAALAGYPTYMRGLADFDPTGRQ